MIDPNLSVEDDAAIVNPVVNAQTPKLGPVTLIVSPKKDFNHCRDLMEWPTAGYRHLYLSRLYYSKNNTSGISLVGPVIGAPYAAMILESLIAWGSRQVIFLGWCGSIDPHVRTGDIFIPDEAIIDEGTSRHYLGEDIRAVKPSAKLARVLHKTFTDRGVDTHKGSVWTTDAVFRETKAKIRHHQRDGILGVEMELSALLSVGHFRSINVAGVLVVSDELSTMKWQPGFKSSEFQKGRIAALEGLLACSRRLSAE
jgi:uridine phosphorylase